MTRSLTQGLSGRLFVAAIVALALMGLHAAGTTRHAEAITNCDVQDLTYEQEEADFLTLINDYRASKGKDPLTVSQHLNQAASWQAHSLATEDYFSHTDSSGRTASARAKDCGAQGGIGENITAGTVRDTAQEAFDAWKASAGHNANMLNDSYRQIGIARYYDASSTYLWYWVTVFSNADDGTRLSAEVVDDHTSSSTDAEEEAAQANQEEQITTEVVDGPKATMTLPVPGTTLESTDVEFLWQHGIDATAYYLYIGSSVGGHDYLAANLGYVNTVTVTGFPSTGETIYVRLWTLTPDGWQYNDYEYTLPGG